MLRKSAETMYGDSGIASTRRFKVHTGKNRFKVYLPHSLISGHIAEPVKGEVFSSTLFPHAGVIARVMFRVGSFGPDGDQMGIRARFMDGDDNEFLRNIPLEVGLSTLTPNIEVGAGDRLQLSIVWTPPAAIITDLWYAILYRPDHSKMLEELIIPE